MLSRFIEKIRVIFYLRPSHCISILYLGTEFTKHINFAKLRNVIPGRSYNVFLGSDTTIPKQYATEAVIAPVPSDTNENIPTKLASTEETASSAMEMTVSLW